MAKSSTLLAIDKVPLPSRRPRASGIVILVIVAVFGFIALPAWHLNRPPFSLKLLDRLHPGMSKLEVEAFIGPPLQEDIGGDTWSYSRSGSWPIVYIHFDGDGKLRSSEYDY